MTRTPVASRPWAAISRTEVRIITPADETTMISSSRRCHQRGDDRAPALGQLDAPDALSAAGLGVEVVELGSLAVAGVGDDQQVHTLPGDVARDDLVART